MYRNKHIETSGSVTTGAWLRVILVMIAFGISIQGGRAVTKYGVAIPLLVVGIAAASVLALKPHLALWLIPVGIAIPRTVPRLFGELGPLELVLGIGTVAMFISITTRRRRLQVDRLFVLMLLALLPIALSWLSGRGEGDAGQLYIWLGSSLAYLLALNLARRERESYWLLGAAALLVIGLLVMDVYLSGVARPSTTALGTEWTVYRQTAATVGMGNFAMVLMAVVLPVPLAYGLVTNKREVRLISFVAFILGTYVAFTFLTRAVLLSLGASALAMGYVLWHKQGARGGARTLGMILILAIPIAILQMREANIVSLFTSRLSVQETLNDPRIGIWLGLLEKAARSPLWGYGAVDPWRLFGISGSHGTYPQALFEYGVSFTLPLVLLLVTWLRQSWRFVQRKGLDHRQFAFALASWGIVIGVLIITIPNDYVYRHGAYSSLAFFTAGLLMRQVSAQAVQNKDRIPENHRHIHSRVFTEDHDV